MAMDEAKWMRVAQVGQVFSPGAPINRYDLFSGRLEQVREVINAINQRGQHVILYGERGVGKTSLANVISDFLGPNGNTGFQAGSINCDGTDDFSSIWRKVFRELPAPEEWRNEENSSSEDSVLPATLDSYLPARVSPDDIRYVLRHLPYASTIVIDEVDRIRDKRTPTLLADTIKNLSDHSVNTTLIMVGVADSVDQLISQHESVERSLRQVRMPRMSENELYEVLDKGLETLGLTIDEKAKRRIARLSEGLPHYTHLLGLDAAQRAILDDRNKITMIDVDAAVRAAVTKAQQSILNAYHKATSSPQKDAQYGRVLLACALAPTDGLGFFSARDVRDPVSKILGKAVDIPAFSRHLNHFADANHGPVLEKKGVARRFRFRFTNPMMQPFVILHGLATGLLTDDVLAELQYRQADEDDDEL